MIPKNIARLLGGCAGLVIAGRSIYLGYVPLPNWHIDYSEYPSIYVIVVAAFFTAGLFEVVRFILSKYKKER